MHPNTALDQAGTALAEPVGPDTLIADYFRSVVASGPDALALTTAGARFTYGEIDRWSDAIASDIAASNAPLDQPVAIITRDNVPLVPAALAVVKAGHFFVMIDASDPDERIALILRESSAALCLVDSDGDAPAAARALPLLGIRPFSPTLEENAPQRPAHRFVHAVFTSGTTGKPKAVLTAQRHFVEESLAKPSDGVEEPGNAAPTPPCPAIPAPRERSSGPCSAEALCAPSTPGARA